MEHRTARSALPGRRRAPATPHPSPGVNGVPGAPDVSGVSDAPGAPAQASAASRARVRAGAAAVTTLALAVGPAPGPARAGAAALHAAVLAAALVAARRWSRRPPPALTTALLAEAAVLGGYVLWAGGRPGLGTPLITVAALDAAARAAGPAPDAPRRATAVVLAWVALQLAAPSAAPRGPAGAAVISGELLVLGAAVAWRAHRRRRVGMLPAAVTGSAASCAPALPAAEPRAPRDAGPPAPQWLTEDGPATTAAGAAAFRGLFTHADTGLAVLDATGRVLAVNPALHQLLGSVAGQLVGAPAEALLADPLDAPGTAAAGTAAPSSAAPSSALPSSDLPSSDLPTTDRRGAGDDDGADRDLAGHPARLPAGTSAVAGWLRDPHAEPMQWPAPVLLRGLPGAQRWVQLRRTPLVSAAGGGAGPGGALCVLQIIDVTSERRSEDLLAFRAAHDALTGLPNRSQLVEELAGELLAGHHVGVLFVDLDRFKAVNDGSGHVAGDRLLVQVAHRLTGAIRAHDTVARIGGDEFVVVCRAAQHPETAAVASRVLEALSRPLTDHTGNPLVVGASIGLAVSAPGDTAEQLLAAADAAMYSAKGAGGGRVSVYSPALRAAAVRTATVESALRLALPAGALRLRYQPITDLARGQVVGCEALARWTSPTLGRVSPVEFVAVAERSSLAVDLGVWALRQALTDVTALPPDPRGVPVSVAVNISVKHLLRPGFATAVRDLVAEAGIGPSQLGLELTETALADDVGAVVEVLTVLRDLGVRLSIDDFGTGHASLTYLARFPVDTVKVDRSFVRGLGADGGSQAIVSGVIAMAHSFGMQVVAEGVETPQQLAALRDLGCDRVQGFLLHRPLTLPALRRLLLEHPAVPTDWHAPGRPAAAGGAGVRPRRGALHPAPAAALPRPRSATDRGALSAAGARPAPTEGAAPSGPASRAGQRGDAGPLAGAVTAGPPLDTPRDATPGSGAPRRAAGRDSAGGAAARREDLRHRLLLDGAREVTSCTALDEVLARSLQVLRRAVQFTGGSIQLVDGDVVRLAATDPPATAAALGASIPLGQGVSGTIALTGEPRYLPDITIAATVAASRRRSSASAGVRAYYGVPLVAAGAILGVLQVDSTTVDAFDEHDRLLVLAFAPVVASAVQQAVRRSVPLRAAGRGPSRGPGHPTATGSAARQPAR